MLDALGPGVVTHFCVEVRALITDLSLAAAIAALPWLTMNSVTEPKRLGFLAAVFAATVLLRKLRDVAQVAIGLTMLAVAWFESFPAWNHSAEVGSYIVCGTVVLALASYRAARRSQLSTA